jgi:hypothetical protein
MAKRELIHPGTDQRFVRRIAAGEFKKFDDVSPPLERRVNAATNSKSQGDKRDL